MTRAFACLAGGLPAACLGGLGLPGTGCTADWARSWAAFLHERDQLFDVMQYMNK